jgi:hypothetical protein
VVTNGFYEWKKLDAKGKFKQAYAVDMAGGGEMVMAGLWSKWRDPASGEEVLSCTEATIASLEDKRRQLVERRIVLDYERQQASYAAHTGDKAARAKLDKLKAEHATFGSEFASIESAIVEAKQRLDATKAAEAQAASKANALALREKLVKLKEVGQQIDDAIWDIGSSVNEMKTLLDEIHSLGAANPTHEQFRVSGSIALRTMMQTLPRMWVKEFDFDLLQPYQKKNFKDVVNSWHDMIERQIAQRLGKDRKVA